MRNEERSPPLPTRSTKTSPLSMHAEGGNLFPCRRRGKGERTTNRGQNSSDPPWAALLHVRRVCVSSKRASLRNYILPPPSNGGDGSPQGDDDKPSPPHCFLSSGSKWAPLDPWCCVQNEKLEKAKPVRAFGDARKKKRTRRGLSPARPLSYVETPRSV